jgi:hypothetical protein
VFDKIIVFADCVNLYNCPKGSSADTVTQINSTISQPLSSFNFYDFVSNFNYFALAWTMFYTFVLMTNFYYWRIISHRERLHHEAKGVKSIQDIVKFWWRYLITLFIFTFVSIYRDQVGLAILLLFIYFIFYFRKFWFDSCNLMESIGESFDQIGWKGNWPKDVASNMKKTKLLNLFTSSSKKK